MGRVSKSAWDHHYAYNAKPENIEKRSNNNKARRIVAKEVGKEAMDGKDVHHKKPQRSGGSNAKGNLALRSPSSHRGWKDDKK